MAVFDKDDYLKHDLTRSIQLADQHPMPRLKSMNVLKIDVN